MRQYICDVCHDELSSHTTEVRGGPEAVCDACLAPPGGGRLTYEWERWRAEQAGLARARTFLRKQQYWRLEAPGEQEHDQHN